jgi:hypothetical protein
MKKTCFFVLTLSLLVFGHAPALAQSGKMPWVDGVFPPVYGPYEYRVARGEGASLSAARDDALYSFLTDLGNIAGVSITSRTLSEIKRSLKYQNGGSDYNESESSTTTYRIDREGFKASFIKVGECYERAGTGAGTVYRVWELYEYSSRKSFTPYIPEYTGRYGADAFWRSMLFPGWGQLYKGSRAKGLSIIGGEAVFVGGLVAAENLRVSYLKKIAETHNTDHIRIYANKANTMETVRNLCIAGTAALYLYSLIDAVASPGNMHLVDRNRSVAFYPVAGDASAGVVLVVNF